MMRVTICACVAAATTLLMTSAASAQDISYNVGVVSDYVFRGFSQTDEDFALQGGVDLTTDSGFYLGAWGSNVDFYDSTDAEIDVYGGYRTEAGGFSLDFGAIYYGYVDQPSGADYDFVEVKAAVSRSLAAGSIGAAVYYSPDFFGGADEATYVEVNGSFAPAERFTVGGAVGYQDISNASGYSTWNLGVGYALTENLALDVRYHDSDEDTFLSDSRFVVGLKATF